jgi:hypothetical protein
MIRYALRATYMPYEIHPDMVENLMKYSCGKAIALCSFNDSEMIYAPWGRP